MGTVEYQQERKGFWYEPAGTGTSEAIALETWARVAHPILEETAHSYHGVISESALVERLKADSGINTARPHDRWLLKVLAPLARVHHQDGYPTLTALVVDDRGWVGERYDDLLRAQDGLPVSDPVAREKHAARARLACYQWAGSAPEDGGLPAEVPMSGGRRAPRPASTRTASTRAASPRTPRAPREPKAPAAPKRVAASDRPVNVCPRCFMAVPATGLCDNCD